MKFDLKKLSYTSISTKLTLSYILIVFIPIFSAAILFISYFSNTIENKYLNTVYNNLGQIDNNITSNVISIMQIGKSIAADSKISNFLSNNNQSDIDTINMLSENILPSFNRTKIDNPIIRNLLLIHGNKTIFDVPGSISYRSNINTSEWSVKFKKMRNLENVDSHSYYKVYLEPLHSNSNKNEQVYSFYFPIYNFSNLNYYLGVLEIDVEGSAFIAPLMKNNPGKGDIVCFVDGMSNSILYTNNKDINNIEYIDYNKIANFSEVKIGDINYRIIKRYDSNLKCYFVQFICMNNIFRWGNMVNILILGALILILSLIAVSWSISKIVLKNLYKLTNGINKVKEGNFDYRVDIASLDEIGQLSINFNDMTDKINKLMIDLEKSNAAEKEAIYSALENQIKPHFLCNALDMVRMTAELRNETDISNALQTTTHYFMYNLSQRGKYVTLEDELKNVSDYIDIHNLIKNNKIEYDINVDGEINGSLNKFMILKFSLQPIVENSIKHGFKEKLNNCCIFIKIMKNADDIFISIEDTGKGMTEERILELNKSLNLENIDNDLESSNIGIGLRNIKKRFLMNYGDKFSFVVESCMEIGTCITLKIPVIPGKICHEVENEI